MSVLERETDGVVMTPQNIRTRRLPLVVNVVVAVVAVGVAAAIVPGLGIGNWVLVAVLGLVFYVVGLLIVAGRVEGRRAARNRMWKTLVYTACVLAVLPLASVVWTLLSKGVGRLDANFFGTSMNNIGARDPNGGAYHAIIGTLEQVGIATLLAVPLGVLGAIYLVEYGRGRFALTRPLLRRRHDRHPVDRGRPVHPRVLGASRQPVVQPRPAAILRLRRRAGVDGVDVAHDRALH
jgi:phosphate transport system permease protein